MRLISSEVVQEVARALIDIMRELQNRPFYLSLPAQNQKGLFLDRHSHKPWATQLLVGEDVHGKPFAKATVVLKENTSDHTFQVMVRDGYEPELIAICHYGHKISSQTITLS